MSTLQQRFDSKYVKEPTSGCWLWTAAVNNAGYGKIWDGDIIEMAHRMSYRLHKGAIPSHLIVRHSCDNPACVNPDHLDLGTRSDNTQDCLSRGRHVAPRGAMNSRLTGAQVAEIRALPGGRSLPAAVAAQYGITAGGLYKIRAGLRWKETA